VNWCWRVEAGIYVKEYACVGRSMRRRVQTCPQLASVDAAVASMQGSSDEIRLDRPAALVPWTASHVTTTCEHPSHHYLIRTMAYSSPRHSQNFYQYDASTPPPPPPKPGRSSGTGTPSQGPPLPPPPAVQASDAQQYSQAHYQQNPQGGPEQLAIQPPEDGWLPGVLKDKSYVKSWMLTSTLLR